MKGVKLDIVAADIRVVALVSRSLSATSEMSGSGTALTEVKKNAAARKVVETKVKNIFSGCQKRWRGQSNERSGKGSRGERMNATLCGNGRPCPTFSLG